MTVKIQRDCHLRVGRNWGEDPLSLMCRHAATWCGWKERKLDALRREFFNGIRKGEETFLGYSGMILHTYPISKATGRGTIYLDANEDSGACVGAERTHRYVYWIIPDGIDAVEYDPSLCVEGRDRPDWSAIGRFLLEATEHYTNAHIQEGALDDLLNWFTLD
ncbi:MAG: hypothetical protein IJR14_07330, partial [Synergistaceae bacterium]|nr:hypothetical protein [Synergistaceae bacterium]